MFAKYVWRTNDAVNVSRTCPFHHLNGMDAMRLIFVFYSTLYLKSIITLFGQYNNNNNICTHTPKPTRHTNININDTK